MIGENVKLVIFDLYSTLVAPGGRNGGSPFEKLFRYGQLDEAKRKEYRDLFMTHHYTFDNIVKEFFSLSKAITDNIKKDLETEIANTKTYPEVHRVLSVLKRKYKLALISNLFADYKEPFFNLGLDKYFNKVIFSCDVGHQKPEPQIYQMAMMGYKPKQIIMIGDSVRKDYNAPRGLGFDAIVIDRKGNKQAQHKISNLAELI